MINAITLNTQRVTSMGSVHFDKTQVCRGSDVSHIEGSSEFRLNRPRIYEVRLDVVFTYWGSVIHTRLTDGLHPNGSRIEEATVRIGSGNKTSSFSTLVRVGEGCPYTEKNPATLTFYCPASISAARICNGNVVIRRLPAEEPDCGGLLEKGCTVTLQKE